MVAPEHDFATRSERRNSRILARFSEPAQPAQALLQDRHRSLGIRAAVAALFGVAVLWPAIPEAVVVRLFAVYAFADGFLALAPGGWGVSYRLGWPLMVGGCISIIGAVAVYLWLWIGMTLDVLVAIAMLCAFGHAAAFTLACLALRNSDAAEPLLLCGIASLIFGRALLSQLATDPIVVSTWMGVYAMTMAVLLVKVALKRHLTLLL